jgi:GH25 family lysozyme M1 (1,4-beta-N-acetylmuramidase)
VAQANPVPGISGNVDRDVFYGTLDQLKSLRLGKDTAAKPGDFNRDGKVDTADYNKWLADNGKTVPMYTGADANGDARVNSSDYSVWLANVPEPGSWILLLIGWGAAALDRRRCC